MTGKGFAHGYGGYETRTNAVIPALGLGLWWNSVHFVLDHPDGVYGIGGIENRGCLDLVELIESIGILKFTWHVSSTNQQAYLADSTSGNPFHLLLKTSFQACISVFPGKWIQFHRLMDALSWSISIGSCAGHKDGASAYSTLPANQSLQREANPQPLQRQLASLGMKTPFWIPSQTAKILRRAAMKSASALEV